MKACCEEWLKEQFGDDPETLATVYGEYAATMTEQLAALDAALASGEAQRIDVVLHTIKGTASMVGDMELSELAARARRMTGNELQTAVAHLRVLAAAI